MLDVVSTSIYKESHFYAKQLKLFLKKLSRENEINIFNIS